MATDKKNPFHMENCGACGARLFIGTLTSGAKVKLDLDAKVYCIVGGRNPSEIVQTELAMPLHSDVCPYRDA